MSEQREKYNTSINREIKFNDGSLLSITASRGQAETAFHHHFSATLEEVRHRIAKEQGICCDELKNALGKTDRYPRLAYISVVDWQGGKKSSWFPGADKPGFYKIYEVRTPENEEDQIIYRPLDYCPFCHVRLWNE